MSRSWTGRPTRQTRRPIWGCDSGIFCDGYDTGCQDEDCPDGYSCKTKSTATPGATHQAIVRTATAATEASASDDLSSRISRPRGDPLLDSAGGVVGIVSWRVNAAGFEGLGFGVPGAVVQDRLALSFGTSTDAEVPPFSGDEPVAVDPAVVDTPDEPRLAPQRAASDTAVKNRNRRVSGLVLVGLGGALAGSTAAIASSAEQATDLKWATLATTNALGWVTVAGGTILIGTTFPASPAAGPSTVVVSGRF